MKILGIIPARYASSRFPAKPLADIGGKPMIQRVYEQAKKSKLLTDVVVATDHREILDCVTEFGGHAVLTSEKHESGTDRCAEVAANWKEPVDYVVNIQGDEPFISPDQIDLLATLFDGKVELATLIKKIEDHSQLVNPHVVKVLVSATHYGIYFSRTPLPYQRSNPTEWLKTHTYFKHIGMYGYKADVLQTITNLPISKLEKAESLEQLRWIENGYSILTAETEIECVSIDTPEDLERARNSLSKQHG
ncbi:MAG: 3-deoxy-manno-octulosonate cytidylyltransferase [Flammeovirgaceae bacterium]|nr:3-deoxy-manno-octulosonate cytidylyltransferase [Flammeovirgaceae bacterium]